MLKTNVEFPISGLMSNSTLGILSDKCLSNKITFFQAAKLERDLQRGRVQCRALGMEVTASEAG